MRIRRRSFLKLFALLSASLGVRAEEAFAGESAVGIHRATRNTLLGALGSGVREMLGSLTPFKGYPGLARVKLGTRPTPAATPLVQALARASGEAHDSGKGLDRATDSPRVFMLEDLARLLYFTNGDTGRDDGDPYKLRAAPSAGALYAGEVYALALAVGGLDAGVYYYDVGSHELVRVREKVDGLEGAFDASDWPAGAAALICISNVFERYEHRYSNRGYRYALVDTGHIGENLRLASAAAGIVHRALPRFCDDQLNTLLGVDGYNEAVCAVHAVGGALREHAPGAAAVDAQKRSAAAAGASGHAASSTARTHAAGSDARERAAGTESQLALVEKQVAGAQVTKEPEPTLRYHDGTKLVRARPKTSRRENHRRHAADASLPATTKRVALPRLEAEPAAGLELCIAARRSPKSFAQRAITLAQLGFVVRSAQPPAARQRSLGLDLLVAVHRVTDLAQGLYLYAPDSGDLAVVREDDLTDTLPRACLGQAKAADAAVGVCMVGHVRHAAAMHGERAYRDLLIESGEVGQRIYLAAEAVGLAARNLAAFLDDELNELVAIDGRELAVVHLTMVGHGA